MVERVENDAWHLLQHQFSLISYRFIASDDVQEEKFDLKIQSF